MTQKKKISEIENPKWYILDRNSNSGYVSFIQDTKSIDNISKVFPVVFFIVATLISLTSMTRMVEEQRGQIGTLKALGYNKLQIMMKYIIYAGIATIVGSVLGMCVGFVILPEIIWMMYGMMYQMTDKILIAFNWKYGGIRTNFNKYMYNWSYNLYNFKRASKHTISTYETKKHLKVGIE